jgi:AraC family transcriptional regulator of arabinose operon
MSTSRNKHRKRQGFEGQRLIVLPKKITTDFLTRDPVTKQIYITDIGYYPRAKFHYVDRPAGVSQHIIIYNVEGSGWVGIDKKRTTLSASQFIVIPANTPHKYASNENDPWTIYWLHFRGDLATYIVDLILQNTRNYKPDLAFSENRIKLFEDIYSGLEKGYGSDNLRYVNMIFYHFLSSLLYEEKFSSSEKRKEGDLIADTIELMQKKTHTVISLQELARFAKLSVSHFSAVFRERTGYSPIEYFNHLKIQKACQYLLFTGMTVKETAASLGIDDQYYFSRMFTKLMGHSPVEYRKRNKTGK